MKLHIPRHFHAIKSLFFITLLSSSIFNQNISANELISAESKFKQIIVNLNHLLSKNEQVFKVSKIKLADFVDKELLPIWSSAKTLKGLLGKKDWGNFSTHEQKELVYSFNNTLQRYVQEGFDKYDGQKLEFVSVRLSQSKTRGYLTVKVVPNVLPDFNIDFKIALFNGDWYLYDAGAQGINYISLKKDSFRKSLKNGGFSGVLSYLDKKNIGYTSSRNSK